MKYYSKYEKKGDDDNSNNNNSLLFTEFDCLTEKKDDVETFHYHSL